jgi:hypothetical protein
MQGLEADLDEHRRAANMFHQVVEYNVHMTNILLGLSNLEINNKQIIEEDIFVYNLHGDLEKEQKLKAKLQFRESENSEIFIKLQIAIQKINNMEKHNKDLENNILERDSL